MVHKRFKGLKLWQKRVYAILIGAAIVLFWRGIWHLADVLLFPDNYILSAIASLIIALTILMAARHAVEGLIGI